MPEITAVPRGRLSVQEMSRLADRLGWKSDLITESAGGEDLLRHRWRVDSHSTITLVQSAALDLNYLRISASDSDEVLAAITKYLPCYTTEDIIEFLHRASTEEDRVEALSLLAAARLPTYREDVYRLVVECISDPSAVVRVAALMAAFNLNWHDLLEPVTHASQYDESENVRSLSWNYIGLTDWSGG